MDPAADQLEPSFQASWRAYRELQLSELAVLADLPADVQPWDPDPGPLAGHWPGIGRGPDGKNRSGAGSPGERPGSARSATRAAPPAPTAPATPLVITRFRDPEHPGGQLHRQALTSNHRDRLVAPFGSTTSPRSSAARRWMASSCSSSAIRFRAATSSAWSLLVIPGIWPSADQLLPPPDIDHLRADLQIIGNLSDRAASGDQVQDLPAKLGRVTPRHNILHGLLDG